MKLGLWSTTAASNNSTPPDGWPEGQAPSTVNDCAREMMAAIRTTWNDAQFFDQGLSPTFVSTTSFTVAGDQTSAIHAGRRLKLFDATAGVATTIYATVLTASFTVVTTVQVANDAGQLTASLSSFAISILSNTNSALPRNPSADRFSASAIEVTGILSASAITTTTLTVSGASVFKGAASFSGAVAIAGALSVSGTVTLAGGIAGVLSVSGATQLNSTLTVSGTTVLLGALSVSGVASFLSGLSASGSIVSNTRIKTPKVAAITGGNQIYSVDAATSHLFKIGGTSVWAFDGTTSTLRPMSDNAFDLGSAAAQVRDGFFGRNVAVGGTLTVSGATVLKSALSVGGATTLASTLSVGGDLIVGTLQDLTLHLSTGTAEVDALNVRTLLLQPSGNPMEVRGPTLFGRTITASAAVTLQTTLTVSGATTLLGALNVSGTATLTNGQLIFPAAQNASANANCLDDYEEGTFTPTLLFSASAQPAYVVGGQLGRYTKIGNNVNFSLRIILSATAGIVGVCTVGGLPFSANASGAYQWALSFYGGALSSMSGHVQPLIAAGASVITINQLGTGTNSQLTQANFTNTSDIVITGSYQV